MLTIFKKYQGYLIAVASVSCAAGAALFHDGAPWYSAAGFVLAVCLVALVILNTKANLLHRQVLSILYHLCLPGDFVRIYEPLTQQKRVRKNALFTTLTYLSNGYAAMGNFVEALAVLDRVPVMRRNKEAPVLLAGNRCSCYLYLGQMEQARLQLELLKKTMLSLKGKKLQQYVEISELLRIRLELARGTVTQEDAEYLKHKLRRQNSPYHSAELNYLLGLAYQQLWQDHLAKDSWQNAITPEGKLWFQEQAKACL